MVTNFNTCNLKETLSFRLEQLKDEFDQAQAGERNERQIRLSNDNAKALNESLRKLRSTLASPLKTKEINSSLKIQLGIALIPNTLLSEYQRSNITTVSQFVNFFNTNIERFEGATINVPIGGWSEMRVPGEVSTTFTPFESISVPRDLFRDFEGNTIEDLFREFELKRSELKLIFSPTASIRKVLPAATPTSFKTFPELYPNIELRLSSGDISSAETNSFIREAGIDEEVFGERVQENPRATANLFEKFLGGLGIGLGIIGPFCLLVENVYALVNGLKDISGDPSAFLSNFGNVLSLINPEASRITHELAELTALVHGTQQSAEAVSENMQGAFSTLAAPFGVAMNFFNRETNTGGSISVNWDLDLIKDELLTNSKFEMIVPSTGNRLGDINQDGFLNSSDETAFQSYIDDSATPEVKNYIENVMFAYMNEFAGNYAEFGDFPSASSSNFSQLLNIFSAASSLFGSPSSPNTGTFGINQLSEMITILNGLNATIQGIAGGSLPANITGILSSLDRILSLAKEVDAALYSDFNAVVEEYHSASESVLVEAEENAVEDPETALQIANSNASTLEEEYSSAVGEAASVSSNLGGTLSNLVGNIRNSISRLAAVGVLDQLGDQLVDVVEASSSNLRDRLEFVSPETLDNGYHVNMESSYARMSGLIGSAQIAANEETTEEVKNSVRGLIGQAAESFREFLKEDVEFIALRFCKLAGEIERIYSDVLIPIQEMQSNFSTADAALSTSGNEATLGAIEAGALRYDTAIRLQAMREAGDIFATLASPYINAAGQRSIIPEQGTRPDTFPPLPADYRFPPFERLLLPGNPLNAILGIRGTGPTDNVGYNPGPASRESEVRGFVVTNDGQGGVDEKSFIKLFNLARNWRDVIIVISAFRNVRAQEAIYGRGTKKRGYHFSGQAFDVSMGNNFSRQYHLDFMNAAYLAGFRGITSYGGRSGNFVHIDTGPSNRPWNGGGPVPYYYGPRLAGPLGYRTFR
jgi:hypothetical protein